MRNNLVRRILSLIAVLCLSFQQTGFAQGIAQLDIAGYLSKPNPLSAQDVFRPLHLRYFSYDSVTDDFRILLDKGDLKNLKDSQIKEQGQELLKYFLVGISLPDDNFWVNLRPDSEEQIISPELARTDLGKVLLEADLQLKKDVARFTSPETREGREYWDKLYKKAEQIFGSENITIPTLTRPWIVPGEVIIRENSNSAYVYKGTLKVMLEQDHLKNSADYNFSDPRLKELNEYSSQLIREKIIPKLSKEVNSSKKYAALRQIFYSLILSRWFKHKFAGKEGLYPNLINTANLNGLTSQSTWTKTTYFQEYQKSFSKGEYNIKEQVNGLMGPVIRTYFSGGILAMPEDIPTQIVVGSPISAFTGKNHIVEKAFGNGKVAIGGTVRNGELTDLTILQGDKMGPGDLIKEPITVTPNIGKAGSPLQIRTDFTVPEGQKEEFFTSDYHGYMISELFEKPIGQIPDAVVKAVKDKLKKDVAEGKILSAQVDDYGASEIGIQVTHRYGELNAAVQRLIIEAMKEGALKAQELGLLKKDIDVASMSLEDLAKNLRLKREQYSITERGSESFVRVKLVGAGIGAANIILYHQFFIPGATPLQPLGLLVNVDTKKKDKLPVRGFRAVVRRVDDVLKGKLDGDVWEYENSVAVEIDGVKYPSVDQSRELLTRAGQTNDFVITEIYPVEGSLVSSKEPLVKVVYQPVYGEKGNLRTLNPTFLCRSQSGADAVGGVASMFYDVNFVPGGPNGENQVVTMPVTKKEARKAPPEGIAYVVVDGWQFKGNGIIPQEKEGVMDHVGINPVAFPAERSLAKWLASIMTTHKDEQPYLSPFAAEARVESLRKAQAHLFKRAPKEADIDPVMDEVEAKVQRGELGSFDDDKADMGGKFGHNFTPEYMLAIDRATHIEATEKGEISDGNIIGFTDRGRLKNGTTPSVGDDSHNVTLGDKSRNAANSHQNSFTAFTRGYLASLVGNMVSFDPAAPLGKPKSLKTAEKPYGRAQDYAGKEAKAAMANPYFYSRLSERFFEILRQTMPLDYMQMVENMHTGWKYWQEHGTTGMLPKPFSGNVSSQGMGTARYLVDIANGEREVGVLAGDKNGPAALNRPIREGVYAALEAGEFANGLVFEIWDAKAFDELGNIPVNEIPESYADIADAVGELKDEAGNDDKVGQDLIRTCYKDGTLIDNLSGATKEILAELIKKSGFVPTKRIYLDAQQDKEAIFLYLADSDRFNIKQVWAKKKAGWDVNNFQAYLDRPILGSSVTKLGILAGGAYIGKDDPVMVGHMNLMKHIFEFLKTNPLIIQGDMNGSHWLAAIPTAFKYAVANKESHPILVGLVYTLSEDGKTLASVEDVFGKKEFAPIRKKMFEFNFKFKRACLGGQFEPYGTNRRTIEASYPKNQLLAQLDDPRSPYMIKNMTPESRKLRPITMMEPTAELFKAATSASSAINSLSTGYDSKVAASSTILSNSENLDSALNPGGIDFRVIPMITQPMGNLSGLNFSLPKLSNLESIDLDEELSQIKDMLKAGITPSGERLKEYVAACYQKGVLKQHMDEIVASLVDTCKLEEEKMDQATNEVKELMLILDSTG